MDLVQYSRSQPSSPAAQSTFVGQKGKTRRSRTSILTQTLLDLKQYKNVLQSQTASIALVLKNCQIAKDVKFYLLYTVLSKSSQRRLVKYLNDNLTAPEIYLGLSIQLHFTRKSMMNSRSEESGKGRVRICSSGKGGAGGRGKGGAAEKCIICVQESVFFI